MDPSYTKAQKLASIDHALGKRVSYSPDFETELCDEYKDRALWKILATGYGVCNGIAFAERYMLKRAGIESEVVSSSNHAFLKVKNIEFELANGKTVCGNTIVDGTWNLTNNLFDARPGSFAIDYSKARSSDVDRNGVDHKCHMNDEALKDVNVSLDDESLRKLYSSIGVADKDGKFKVSKMLEKSAHISEEFAGDTKQNILKHFELIKEFCPDFARKQNSSIRMLNTLLSNKNIGLDKCVLNRVYEKKDEKRDPVIYAYMESEKIGKRFYYADKEAGSFIELSQEEFVERFDCYDKDLEKSNGVRPWESKSKEDKEIDLSKNSGTSIVASDRKESR